MKKGEKSGNKSNKEKITRKEAIKKAAGIAGLTAASIIFLDTKASAGTSGVSPSAPPNW